MKIAKLGLMVTLVILVPGGARAEDPEPGTPAWHARALANHADALGRNIDQLSNPEYLSLQAAACAATFDDGCVAPDPFRLAWGETRGRTLAVSYQNRYGVRIHARLHGPRSDPPGMHPGSLPYGPSPAVIVANSNGGSEQLLWGMAQGLAEAGYIVMGFDQQCEGDSACQPDAVFCDAGGGWREPQEMGLRETGPCAGQDAPDPEPLWFPLHAGECIAFSCDQAKLAQWSERQVPRRVLGALDAVGWLLSGANPWRDQIDPARIGIVGHSFGGDVALYAANGDPLHRFRAAVSWDGPAVLPPWIAPRVPTMFQQSDLEEDGPRHAQPSEYRNAARNATRFVLDGVDTMVLAPRGSTHQEWNHTPFFGPAAAGRLIASRDGERVGLYYTLAWLDRYLRGYDDAAAASDARNRLTADVFDDSADRSSIGQGWWDPVAQRNVPYAIGEETVAEHLSFYFTSSYAFDGLACDDLRAGC